MTSMNANSVFVGSNNSASYHQAIQLPEPKRRALREADRELRLEMRAVAERTVQIGDSMSLATNAYRAQKQEGPSLELRFLLQGGTAYKTDIEPAFTPPQQCDRDTGVYVKTSYVSKDAPGIASDKLFTLVEKSIQKLCEQRGWTIVRKDTCVRVQLNAEMHIDFPLYAIPDDEFVTLQDMAKDTLGISLHSASADMLRVLSDNRNLRIPTDRVMLAHRKEGWMQSDPRALQDWFEEQFRRFPALRRQCRYLKGWRDFFFEDSGPSSVLLMVCAANAYRSGVVTAENGRDDQAFLEITSSLPEMMQSEVSNPVLDVPTALNVWDDIKRQRYVRAANNLNQEMDRALNGHYHQHLTIQRLQSALGQRVPNRPDLVKAHQSAPEIIRPAQVGAVSALPSMRRTTSG